MKANAKLYVVVDGSLPPGNQLAQAVHGAMEFAARHPAIEAEWRAASNTIAVLAADDHDALRELHTRAQGARLALAEFHEPDLGDRMTALTLAPTDAARRLCRGLKLALA